MQIKMNEFASHHLEVSLLFLLVLTVLHDLLFSTFFALDFSKLVLDVQSSTIINYYHRNILHISHGCSTFTVERIKVKRTSFPIIYMYIFIAL